MDKNEFKNMVERYKNELIQMAGLTVKALDLKNSTPQSETTTNTDNTQGTIPQDVMESTTQNNSENQTLPFERWAPYTGKAAGGDSSNETYQTFLDKNKEQGYLKIQAFTARQALPVSGVNIVISKKFSDMEKVFFEGETDESGIIDGITLPAPSKLLSETPENVLPYAEYDISSSYSGYKTQNAPQVQIFQGIKTIQPVQVVP